MFCTYIVASFRNGTLYTGHADDISSRAEEHRLAIFPGFAQEHKCIYLVWYEEHDTRDKAFKRERRIKKWNREWKLNMIEEANPLWLDLGLCSIWPLPDKSTFPEIWNRALSTALPRARLQATGSPHTRG